MPEPIEAALKDEKQVALARLQDSIVESIVEVEPNIVFHGGTAIWRCYSSNRFSEDVGIYATPKQMKKLNWDIDRCLSKRNVHIEYPIGEGAAVGPRPMQKRDSRLCMRLISLIVLKVSISGPMAQKCSYTLCQFGLL